MLFTFIAVIAVILIIVGIMATGSTSGSGGINQTKATKVISEISGLIQSISFYKTTTTNSDYAGLTTAKADAAGVLPTTEVIGTGEGQNGVDPTVYETEGPTLSAGDVIIPSGSLGSEMVFTVNAKAGEPSKMELNVYTKTMDKGLASAINSAYAKLNGGVTSVTNDIPEAGTDAAAIITSK